MSKLNDALGLIQRAEGSIAANADESYGEMLGNLVENFTRKLSQDFGLPVEFFEPVDPDLQDVVSDESDETSENPELTPEAERLYQEIETSI